jgi:hypothetical protein
MERNQRLVEWNVEVLYVLLEKLVETRKLPPDFSSLTDVEFSLGVNNCISAKLVIDEMTDIIRIPSFDEASSQWINNHSKGRATKLLPSCVKGQLREFVQDIASLYRDVPFHNFEHASHVIMSAGKLSFILMALT